MLKGTVEDKGNKIPIKTSDLPIECEESDSFGIKKYVVGLSEYIKECETPTTIAIQGDWGSGKTSMLNMVKSHLGDCVMPIWFNTWQYSKFNMDDTLTISFLTHLCNSLNIEAKKVDVKPNEGYKKRIKVIKRWALRLGSYAVDALGASRIADDMSGVVNSEESEDIISAIEGLKEDFQKTITTIYEKTGKRVVVFIDDLDRLAPSKAVDLMEVLKLFLDCKHCIYVLAIDYGVVTRGVSEKYGDDFGRKQGKKFFDKIIQVPFFIPVEQYMIEDYLKNSMNGRIKLDKEDVEQYIALIKKSVTPNPRSMRRLFNAYLLISTINKDEDFEKDYEKQKLLFAILCMQLTFEDIYKFIAERIGGDVDEVFFAKFLEEKSSDSFNDYFEDIKLTEELDLDAVLVFMEEVAKILCNNAGEISVNKVEKLKMILTLSSSTNVVRIQKKGGAQLLEEDVNIDKVIGPTDVKYKIMTVGAKFHIGFSEKVTFVFNGKEYMVKMHSKAKGRIDGLTEFYKDTGLKINDVVELKYKAKEKKIICEVKL